MKGRSGEFEVSEYEMYRLFSFCRNQTYQAYRQRRIRTERREGGRKGREVVDNLTET